MGMPTTSIAQNPTNQPIQSHQGGKGGGKGMGGSGQQSQYATPDVNPNQLIPDGGNAGPSSNMTSSLVSNQPQMGQPNSYPNTTGSWDNSTTQQSAAMPHMGGKGKGA
jgi:hypothetical protein